MTQADIKQEVYAILQNMGVPAKAITDTASFQKDLGLDSLDFAEMVMHFEMHFQLEIPITEAENITTVKEAITFLSQTLSAKTASLGGIIVGLL